MKLLFWVVFLGMSTYGECSSTHKKNKESLCSKWQLVGSSTYDDVAGEKGFLYGIYKDVASRTYSFALFPESWEIVFFENIKFRGPNVYHNNGYARAAFSFAYKHYKENRHLNVSTLEQIAQNQTTIIKKYKEVAINFSKADDAVERVRLQNIAESYEGAYPPESSGRKKEKQLNEKSLNPFLAQVYLDRLKMIKNRELKPHPESLFCFFERQLEKEQVLTKCFDLFFCPATIKKQMIEEKSSESEKEEQDRNARRSLLLSKAMPIVQNPQQK